MFFLPKIFIRSTPKIYKKMAYIKNAPKKRKNFPEKIKNFPTKKFSKKRKNSPQKMKNFALGKTPFWLDKFIFRTIFFREKLEVTQNWYEAVAMCVPSTSKGIESNNRNIKEDDTFREKWPLGRFCVKSLDIVRNWSADRNPTNVNCKNFNFNPILETKEWKSAWLKSSLFENSCTS
jgi:hypothetical protein